MVLKDGYYGYCEKCGEITKKMFEVKWCKSCQVNYLEKNFTNWSGNELIDAFIKEIRLKVNLHIDDSVFEWILYDQFNDIKEISKDNFSIIYSAKWKNGPLTYNIDTME